MKYFGTSLVFLSMNMNLQLFTLVFISRICNGCTLIKKIYLTVQTNFEERRRTDSLNFALQPLAPEELFMRSCLHATRGINRPAVDKYI